jgi:hypothetical protein
MEQFISVLLGFVFVLFILGLIKPKFVILWNDEKTRKKVSIYYGIPIIVLAIIGGQIQKDEKTKIVQSTATSDKKINNNSPDEHFKNAKSLPISFNEFADLTNRYGFIYPTKNKNSFFDVTYWTDYTYFKEIEVKKNGKEQGKGERISVTSDQKNNIIKIEMLLSKIEIDPLSIPGNRDNIQSNRDYYEKNIKLALSNLKEETLAFITFIFQEDAPAFLNKLTEIREADQNTLHKMNEAKNITDLGLWNYFITIGNKSAQLLFNVDRINMTITTTETENLYKTYNR